MPFFLPLLPLSFYPCIFSPSPLHTFTAFSTPLLPCLPRTPMLRSGQVTSGSPLHRRHTVHLRICHTRLTLLHSTCLFICTHIFGSPAALDFGSTLMDCFCAAHFLLVFFHLDFTHFYTVFLLRRHTTWILFTFSLHVSPHCLPFHDLSLPGILLHTGLVHRAVGLPSFYCLFFFQHFASVLLRFRFVTFAGFASLHCWLHPPLLPTAHADWALSDSYLGLQHNRLGMSLIFCVHLACRGGVSHVLNRRHSSFLFHRVCVAP